VKVITARKTHLVRLSLKEAESKLPKPQFLRISRSHIINTFCVQTINGEFDQGQQHGFKDWKGVQEVC